MLEDALAESDSLFQIELESMDAVNDFPEEVMELKKEFDKMSAKQKETLPAEMRKFLAIKDFHTFKKAMKAALLENKLKNDSILINRRFIYDFRLNNIIAMYGSDDVNNIDTSTAYFQNIEQGKVLLHSNPNVLVNEGSEDTFEMDIVYLTDDSLSLQFVQKSDEPVNQKPLNFKAAASY